MVAGDAAELAAYRQVVAGFEAVQTEVAVRLIEVADRDELTARLSAALAGGAPPDLFLMSYRSYGQFAARGALAPLQPYLDRAGGLEANGFYPQPMAAFAEGVVQTCLPQNASSLVVYYNADLFTAAGLESPARGWRWRDMVGAAAALTRDVDGDGMVDTYGLGVEPALIRLAPFVWSAGGELVDDETEPTRLALGSVPAATAVQSFLDLRVIAGVVPTDEEAEAIDIETRFVDGSLAMLMESRRVVPTLRAIEGFEWDVAPLPVHERAATVLHADAYCLTAAAAHPEQAWAFLEFALGPEGQAIAASTGRTVPSLRSVATSEAFLDPAAAPSRSQVFLDNIEIARAVPHIATWPEIEDAMDGLLEEAFYEPGGAEAVELIAALDGVTAPIFERGSQS